MKNNYLPKTKKELERWMNDNCCNFNGYSINGNAIYEGFGIDNFGGLYSWYYTERGESKKIKYFQSEAEVVEYAFNQIKADRWARTHCIGVTTKAGEAKELGKILKALNVDFFQDEIPYNGLERPVYRTFVLGCDIKKAEHLKTKYYKGK
ncbi:hypothetical protein LQ567_22190 [Niabella pedocola]|uniref:Homing endonuclease LAGLIDADG domain-containing protein n=1 Tax=Niabella pedocola TaxID=1752077 RepID=A0ABS8PZZ8_9BACT|nr:hypothetical protein [Niabella pedocola]MCD2425511.1 hypothetical protein [Niabella pedocola]